MGLKRMPSHPEVSLEEPSQHWRSRLDVGPSVVSLPPTSALKPGSEVNVELGAGKANHGRNPGPHRFSSGTCSNNAFIDVPPPIPETRQASMHTSRPSSLAPRSFCCQPTALLFPTILFNVTSNLPTRVYSSLSSIHAFRPAMLARGMRPERHNVADTCKKHTSHGDAGTSNPRA